jgi:hypothetical protein
MFHRATILAPKQSETEDRLRLPDRCAKLNSFDHSPGSRSAKSSRRVSRATLPPSSVMPKISLFELSKTLIKSIPTA